MIKQINKKLVVSKENRFLLKKKKKLSKKKNKIRMAGNFKEKLTASFLYDEKIAKSFHNMDYFSAEQIRQKNLVEIE